MTARPTLLAELIAGLPAHDRAPAELATGEVDRDEVCAVLGAARVAPSADNAQTWRFVVVRGGETRARLAATAPRELAPAIAAAPVVIAVCGLPWVISRTRREQPFVMLDVPIAVSHMLLQAQELGLCCTWTLDADEQHVRRVLAIPTEVRVIALLALGRGAPGPREGS